MSSLAPRTVLLVNPPSWFERGEPRVLEREAPPLGLHYLAAWVRAYSNRFDVRVLDLGPEGIGLGALARILREIGPFVVGISAMTLQLQGARDVALLVRRELPGARIVLGGSHVSADPGFVTRHADAVDHGITGEAETVFLETLLRLDEGLDVPRLQAGRALSSIDRIPSPDRSRIDRRAYLRPGTFILSRGCPYHCYFCACPAASEAVRYRSVDDVVGEIEPTAPSVGGRIAFADDTFTLNRTLVLDLCRTLAQRRLGLRWSCVTRIDRVDEEIIRAMRLAGCDTVGFGIEAGSERVRKDVIRKGAYTNADVVRAVSTCKAAGMRVNAFLLLGNPTETEAELDETEDLVFRLGLNGIAISLPLPFPGSHLYELAVADGVIDESTIDAFARKALGEGLRGVYPLYTQGHDRDALVARMTRMFRRFYLRPGAICDFVLRDLEQPKLLRDDLRSAFYLLRRGGSRRRPFV